MEYLRYDTGQPQDTLPRLVNARGDDNRTLRVARLDHRRLALLPAQPGVGTPQERLVVDGVNGQLLLEITAERSRRRRFSRGGSPRNVHWNVDHATRTVQQFDVRDEGPWRQWRNPQFRTGDGSFAVLDPVTAGLTELYHRPSLGAEPRDTRYAHRPYAWETVPPWLTGRGTDLRLPFGRPGAFRLRLRLGTNPGWLTISPTQEGLGLIDSHGNPSGTAAEFVRHEDGLGVLVPLHGAPQAGSAEFRFDSNGSLVSQEWPLSVAGLPRDALRVVMRPPTPGSGAGQYLDLQLRGEPDALRRFAVGRMPIELRADQELRDALFPGYQTRDVFTLFDHDTRLRTYHSVIEPGVTLPLWDLPLDGTDLRLLGRQHGQVRVTNEVGRQLPWWHATDAGGARIAVMRDFAVPRVRQPDGQIVPDIPMLLHADTRRLVVASDFTRDEQGMTAEFAVPGAEVGTMVEFRFDAEGFPVREEGPLTGGGSAEERLRQLRIVTDTAWVPVGEDDDAVLQPLVTGRHLQGLGSEHFHVEEIPEAEVLRDPALWRGFTVTETGNGIRRLYRAGAVMSYRDLPLWDGANLRVGVGPRASSLSVVDTDSAPLPELRAERRDDGLVAVMPTGVLINPDTGQRAPQALQRGDGASSSSSP